MEAEAEQAFKPGGNKVWKPAGPAANHRMISGTCLLVHTAMHKFQKVQDAWCCCLLVRGQCYKNVRTSKYCMSLGAVKWAGFYFPLQVTVHSNGVKYLRGYGIKDAHPIKNMFCFATARDDLDEWVGVQVEHLGPDMLPEGLAATGLQLAVVAEVCLIKFALLRRAALHRDDLTKLCKLRNISVNRLPGEKYLTMRSSCTALVEFYLPEEPVETRWSIVQDICGPKKSTNDGSDIAHLLGEGNLRDFSDEMQGRKPIEKAFDKPYQTVTAGDRTPDCIKRLLPPYSNIAWQKSEKTFNGLYHNHGNIKLQFSTRRRYEGNVAGRTLEHALRLVVDTVWKFHTDSVAGAVKSVTN